MEEKGRTRHFSQVELEKAADDVNVEVDLLVKSELLWRLFDDTFQPIKLVQRARATI